MSLNMPTPGKPDAARPVAMAAPVGAPPVDPTVMSMGGESVSGPEGALGLSGFPEAPGVAGARAMLTARAQDLRSYESLHVRHFAVHLESLMREPLLQRPAAEVRAELEEMAKAVKLADGKSFDAANRTWIRIQGGDPGANLLWETAREAFAVLRQTISQPEASSPEWSNRRSALVGELRDLAFPHVDIEHLAAQPYDPMATKQALQKASTDAGMDIRKVLLGAVSSHHPWFPKREDRLEFNAQIVVALRAAAAIGDPSLVVDRNHLMGDLYVTTTISDVLRHISDDPRLEWETRQSARDVVNRWQGDRGYLYHIELEEPVVEGDEPEGLREMMQLRDQVMSLISIEQSWREVAARLGASENTYFEDAVVDTPDSTWMKLGLGFDDHDLSVPAKHGPDAPYFGLAVADAFARRIAKFHGEMLPVPMSDERILAISRAVSEALTEVDDSRVLSHLSKHAFEVRRQEMIDHLLQITKYVEGLRTAVHR